MIYQKSLISKLATFLCLVALSRESTTCHGKTIYHSGKVCAATTATLYNTPAAFCAAVLSFDTIDYCAASPCEDCAEVQNCEDLYTSDTYHSFNYSMQTDGDVYSQIQSCKMQATESCYRTAINDLNMNNFEQTNVDVSSLDLCCMVECDDNSNVSGSVCGNDGALYNNFTEYCTAYCNNRTLSYSLCGTSGCGSAQGCPDAINSCIAIMADVVPVCGSNGTYYATAAAYCSDLDSGAIDGYSTKYCDGTCTEESCYGIECELDIAESGYIASTICGSSGILYGTVDEYCTEYTLGNEIAYLLCNNKACLTDLECCTADCVADTKTYTAGCGNDLNYYSTKSSFCQAKCLDASLAKIQCSGSECTQQQCCNLKCLSENPNDFCDLSTYDLLTNDAYCSGYCSTPVVNYTKEGCTAEGSSVDCIEDDCDYKGCVTTNTSSNGATYNYCGDDGTLYTTTVSYCNALELTQDISNTLLCDGDVCDTTSDCCEAYCVQILFDNGNTYDSICHPSTYDYIEDVNIYCSLACTSGNYTQIAPIDCSEGACTEEECCVERCNALAEFDAVCSSSYDLISSTECNTLCDNTNTFYPCDGDCTQTDCNIKECISNMTGYSSTKVCTKNSSDELNLYDSVSAYCTDRETDSSITSFACNDNDCTDLTECCYNDCLNTNSSFEPLCDTEFVSYTTVEDYCNAECDGGVDELTCEESNCTLLECCEAECNNNAYIIGCHPTNYELVLQAEYCSTSCANDTPMPLDICYDLNSDPTNCDDCYVFKCEDQTDTYTNTSVCLLGDIDGTDYYGTVDDYCTAAIDAELTEFTLTSTTLCGDNFDINCANADNCCIAKCKLNDSYLPSCDLTTFEYYDLSGKCNAECVDDLTLNLTDCTTGCSSDDCLVLECEDTLTATNTSICLTVAVNGDFFFSNINEYCTYLVDNEVSFALTGEISCESGNCEDYDACCMQRCINETFFTSCNSETFDVVTEEDHCSYRCGNDSDIPVVSCIDVGGATVACAERDCNIKECLSANTGYSYDKVCLISDIEGTNFFDSVTSYCEAAVDASFSDYEIGNFETCGENGCDTETACCEARCMLNEYLIGCDPDTFDIVTEESFCSRTCTVEEADLSLLQCDGINDCTQAQCDVKECLDVNSDYSFSTICFTPYDDTSFFGTLTEYCQNKVDNSDSSYLIEGYINCGGSDCVDDNACCNAYCNSNTYFIGCHQEDYELVQQVDYCAYRCENGSFLSLDSCNNEGVPINCTSCAKFECEDSTATYLFTAVCLSSAVEESYYFTSVENYCDAKIAASETDYAIDSYITCDSDNCGSSLLCCTARCIANDSYNLSCDPDTFDLVSLEDYCETI